MKQIDNKLIKAAEIINSSDALIITAGAGMGVDSGLPDFRGDEGFWKAYPPMKKLNKGFMDMANPIWFTKDSSLAWGFYGHRLNLYRKTIPHGGFSMLLEMSEKMKHGHFVFTSNVDGQFQKAGFSDDSIVECHGSIHHFQCSSPCSDNIWDAQMEKVNVNEDEFLAEDPLPQCRNCSSISRPNILMFGDYAWNSRRTAEQEYKMNQWLMNLKFQNSKVTIIEIGAGEAVATVRMTSENLANSLNGSLIRINPRDYKVPPGNNVSIPAGGMAGIEGIYKALRK